MKLLLAEDDRDLNEIIVKKLSTEGYEIDTCYDGESALEHLSFADYDIVILDIMMPKMDGISVVKKLRSENNTTPVIFLTAKDSLSDRVDGLNIGANDYIVKPFSFAELGARIQAVIRTAKGNVSNELKVGDLSLNTDTHFVKRNGTEIVLTAKEYQLLEFLMINKSHILSREKILNHVWGYDYLGGENIIDVYINYLRNKIDKDFEPPLLHTIRGMGYCIKEEQ